MFAAVCLALLGLGAMASRGLYGVALEGQIERIEVRHEKHPPIDDVHLVSVDGDTTHVDRALSRRLDRGSVIRKGRFDTHVEIDGTETGLRTSTDLRRGFVALPLLLLLTLALLAVRPR